jgi:hypothetical protein
MRKLTSFYLLLSLEKVCTVDFYDDGYDNLVFMAKKI